MRKLAIASSTIFDIFSAVFLLFGHISRYVNLSSKGCRIRIRKHLALAIFTTFWHVLAIFVVYISRIIQSCVCAFYTIEKYQNIPIFDI